MTTKIKVMKVFKVRIASPDQCPHNADDWLRPICSLNGCSCGKSKKIPKQCPLDTHHYLDNSISSALPTKRTPQIVANEISELTGELNDLIEQKIESRLNKRRCDTTCSTTGR